MYLDLLSPGHYTPVYLEEPRELQSTSNAQKQQ